MAQGLWRSAIPAFRAAVDQSVRIMSELRAVFDAIAAEVIENQEEEVEAILQKRLKPLANRLNLMLS